MIDGVTSLKITKDEFTEFDAIDEEIRLQHYRLDSFLDFVRENGLAQDVETKLSPDDDYLIRSLAERPFENLPKMALEERLEMFDLSKIPKNYFVSISKVEKSFIHYEDFSEGHAHYDYDGNLAYGPMPVLADLYNSRSMVLFMRDKWREEYPEFLFHVLMHDPNLIPVKLSKEMKEAIQQYRFVRYRLFNGMLKSICGDKWETYVARCYGRRQLQKKRILTIKPKSGISFSRQTLTVKKERLKLRLD